MLNILNLNPGTFGLDISDLSVKLVRIKKNRGGFSISNLNQISLEKGIVKKGEVVNEEKLVKAIKKIVKKTSSLKTKQVVVSLPEEKSFLRVIRMPEMSNQDLRRAVRFEAENYIPFSLDRVYLDSEPVVYLDNKQTEVLVIAMPKKIVDPYVRVIKKAGLIPVALETESQAAARALIQANEFVYLIDFGATSTVFSVYCGRFLCFSSFIPVCSNDFTRAIMKATGKDRTESESLKKIHGLDNKTVAGKKVFRAIKPLVDELVAEIKKHIEYYEIQTKENGLVDTKGSAKKVLLYGGGVLLPGLPDFLSKSLKVEVKKGDPLVNFPNKNRKVFSKRKPLSFAVAIGLALREFYD